MSKLLIIACSEASLAKLQRDIGPSLTAREARLRGGISAHLYIVAEDRIYLDVSRQSPPCQPFGKLDPLHDRAILCSGLVLV